MLEGGRYALQNSTAPSAPRTESRRLTLLISITARFTPWIAGCDFQPKAPRRKRRVNSQAAVLALDILPALPPLASRRIALSSGTRQEF